MLCRALVVFLTAWPTLRLWLRFRALVVVVAVVVAARSLVCLWARVCVVDSAVAVVACLFRVRWAVAAVVDRTLLLSPPVSPSLAFLVA